jgi:DNA mismatch repair ATPase MutL
LEDRIIVKIKEETENSLFYDLLIRPQVLNYGYDNKFIIAYQIYDGSEWYNSNQIAEEKDSLFIQFAKLKEMKHCYWIINKETNQVIGPMRKPEFDRKCEELHVKAKMHHFHEKKLWKNKGL